jgi:hypothetical protein
MVFKQPNKFSYKCFFLQFKMRPLVFLAVLLVWATVGNGQFMYGGDPYFFGIQPGDGYYVSNNSVILIQR